MLRANYNLEERIDYTETLFWSSGLITDDNGMVNISFILNDKESTFRITADFSNATTLGLNETFIHT